MKKRSVGFAIIFMMIVLAAGCSPNSVAQVNTPVPNADAGTPPPNGQINVPGVSIQIYTPGLNPLVNTADAHGRAAGFFLGLWHGVISLITLVVSFFNSNVQMYEVHNDGSLYNLGFLLGVAAVFLILGGIVGSRR